VSCSLKFVQTKGERDEEIHSYFDSSCGGTIPGRFGGVGAAAERRGFCSNRSVIEEFDGAEC
jgi:hypothetical protein